MVINNILEIVNINNILKLVKMSLGISTNIRDDYLMAIINGVMVEIENEKGIRMDQNDNRQLMFVVDYVVWRYKNNGADNMPRHLRYRLNNMMIHDLSKGVNGSVL